MQKQRVKLLSGLFLALLYLGQPALAESDPAISQRLAAQVERWYERAEQGDVNALFNLGQYFRKGIGIEQDLEQAQRFYLRAAELGHPEAQLNLGTLYYFDGEPPNYEQSRHWWLQAARQGNVDAQYQLAVLYLKQDEPVPLDALAWMSLAARAGDPQAAKVQPMLARELGIGAAQLEQRIRELGGTAEASGVASVVSSESAANSGKHEVTEISASEEAVPATADSSTVPTDPDLPAEADTKAAPVSRTAGGYAVQLASLSDRNGAESLAERLNQQLDAVLKGHSVTVVVEGTAAKTAYKVRVTGFADRPSASGLCRELKQQQQPCFVVKG